MRALLRGAAPGGDTLPRRAFGRAITCGESGAGPHTRTQNVVFGGRQSKVTPRTGVPKRCHGGEVISRWGSWLLVLDS